MSSILKLQLVKLEPISAILYNYLIYSLMEYYIVKESKNNK